jgi:hypothetical protein
LKVGEALVSLLHGKGEPSIVERTLIRPPMSRVGPLKGDEREKLLAADDANREKYGKPLDRDSAYERLQERNTAVGRLKERLTSFSNILRGKG